MEEIEKWTSKMKPQGTERYFRIDRYCDAKSYVGMRDQHWQRIKGGEEPWGVSFMRGDEPVLMPRDTRWDSVQIDVAVYDDKMYTISYDDSDGYLCMSAIGETQNKGRVLAKAKISVDKLTPLVANDQGIFVVDAGSTNSDNSVARILWFDHEGSLVKNIMISGDVQETYICGKLLFYLKADNDDLKWCNGCSAYWMDMETEEEHCIFNARYEKQPTENITRCVYVKHIFGNERGAVMLVRFGYEHDVEDGCILNQCGWCYYDFKKIGCLSNSKNGPQHIYNKPEDYERWIEECLDKYGHDPYYINIMAFDMEKNLMWVSKKQNGDGPWEPMNITLDLQKRKRPDLSDWNLSERIEELKESDKIYFDGKRCYTYLHIDGHRDSFCSIDAQGRIERWPVESEHDFRVLGDYVRIIGKLENSDVRYSTQSTPFHYFPTSHEFRKLLCVDENEYPYCVYDMRWMIEEYKEKQLTADEERENQDNWRVMSESDAEDDWGSMTESDEDGCIKIPAGPDDQDDWGKVLKNQEWDIFDAGTEDGEKDEDTTVSGRTDSVPTDSAAQLEYWEGFSSYADSFGLNPAMTLAKLGGRAWQALRMKPSYIRIECSFSARKNSLRTAFIVEGHPEVFAQAERVCDAIYRELQEYDITWDGESNAANISLTTSIDGMSRAEQYNWFCRAAEVLYDVVRPRLDV